MKNIQVEKRWVIVPSCLFPLPPSLSSSLSLRKLFPTEERKLREALWFHLERGGFFTEESMATTTRKKSTREEEHFLSANTTRLVPFLLLREWNQHSFCNLLSLLSCCPSQPCNDTRKPNLLLCYRPTTLNHITSTKNSPALPTAKRRDWREAVSSGGTEASSLPGGAPGAAVDRCGGWGGRPGGP